MGETPKEWEREFTCKVCWEFPNPEILQCRNGHLLCQGCYTRVLTVDRKCPVCRVILSIEPIRCRAAERILENRRIGCPNGCGEMIDILHIAAHEKRECARRKVPCPYAKLGCTEQIKFCDLEQHRATCPIKNLSLDEIMTAIDGIARVCEKKLKIQNLLTDKTINLSARQVKVLDVPVKYSKRMRSNEFSDPPISEITCKSFYRSRGFWLYKDYKWTLALQIRRKTDLAQNTDSDFQIGFRLLLKDNLLRDCGGNCRRLHPFTVAILPGPGCKMDFEPVIIKKAFPPWNGGESDLDEFLHAAFAAIKFPNREAKEVFMRTLMTSSEGTKLNFRCVFLCRSLPLDESYDGDFGHSDFSQDPSSNDESDHDDDQTSDSDDEGDPNGNSGPLILPPPFHRLITTHRNPNNPTHPPTLHIPLQPPRPSVLAPSMLRRARRENRSGAPPCLIPLGPPVILNAYPSPPANSIFAPLQGVEIRLASSDNPSSFGSPPRVPPPPARNSTNPPAPPRRRQVTNPPLGFLSRIISRFSG